MLRSEFSVTSVDLRDILGVSAQLMNDIYGKLKIRFQDESGPPVRGRIKHIPGKEVKRVLTSRGFSYGRKCQVLAFMMCKGGVGKTTSSFFLSQRLAGMGFRVLAIDTDTQGNLTSAFNLDGLGHEIDPETPVVADIVSGKCPPEEPIIKVTGLLHLIPSTPLNANLDSQIRDGFKNFSLAFKKLMAALKGSYDFIVMDCAPALNLTNTAAVCVADRIVMPVAPDKFSRIGLEQTIGEIEQIEEDFSLSVRKNILFTKYDGREFLSFKYLAEIAQYHEDKRLRTAIRTCTDVKNVITKEEDLFLLRRSNAKADYGALALEISGVDAFFHKNRKKNIQDAA